MRSRSSCGPGPQLRTFSQALYTGSRVHCTKTKKIYVEFTRCCHSLRRPLHLQPPPPKKVGSHWAFFIILLMKMLYIESFSGESLRHGGKLHFFRRSIFYAPKILSLFLTVGETTGQGRAATCAPRYSKSSSSVKSPL